MGLQSKEPSDHFTLNPCASFGSFGQKLFGLEADTGAQPSLGGGRGLIDLSQLRTQAYLTGVTTDRLNGFVKWEQPISDNTLVTFIAMGNHSYGHTAYGSTIQQLNTIGRNYGLNSDPKSQANAGYNIDFYDTDFKYVRLRSDLGSGFGIDETIYTASYFRHGTQGLDPTARRPT